MNLLMYTESNASKYPNYILVDAVVVGAEWLEEVQSYPQIYREKDLVVKDCLRMTREKVNLCLFVTYLSTIIMASRMKNDNYE